MEQNHNNKGFTIIEALVSIIILAILLLGMLASLNITYEISVRNKLRNEAIRLAEEYVEKYRNMPITSIPADNSSSPETKSRQIGNTSVNYSIITKSNNVSGLKEITITVKWNYKGKQYSHIITTLVGAK